MAQEAVRFKEFRRFPLLKALDWLETNFRPYNPEQELQVSLFRVPAPKVDMSAFREAIANALIHRDYHQLGAVHVRLENEALVISNPGGLVDGVTLANLLTTEPRPCNPRLADAMKRIGIVERSGRGVDTIYRGLLRFGRPAPNYNLTNASSVVLSLSTADADRKASSSSRYLTSYCISSRINSLRDDLRLLFISISSMNSLPITTLSLLLS